jgi:hypothetical protein
MYIYFYHYEKLKACQYKRNWLKQIYNGIDKFGKNIFITLDIDKSDYIISIGDYVDEICTLYLKKIIVINYSDTIIFNSSLLENKQVIYRNSIFNLTL